MAEVINNRNMAPAKFPGFEELIDAHDSLYVYRNEKQQEYEQKQFDILKSEWAKLTEMGEEYSIIYPDSPADIITEGSIKPLRSIFCKKCKQRLNYNSFS